MTTLLFLQRYWKLIGVGALVLVIAVLIGINAHVSKQRDAAKQEAAQARAALAQQEADVLAKTAAAQAADQAHAKAVEAAQDKVTDDAIQPYRQQLADLDARYKRLLANSAKANPGGGGAASVPSVSDASGRADGAAVEDRLPASDALIASQQALRLQALQAWVRGQQAVAR